MVAVPVNKEVLVWARKERGLSEQEAAKRLDLTTEQLAALENGTKHPSLKMLDRISQKYKILIRQSHDARAVAACNETGGFPYLRRQGTGLG